MIMSSSICRHFSTFPFLKLIEQFNELKSFRRKEKIPTPLLSLLLNLVTSAWLFGPCDRTSAPWAGELQQGLWEVRQLSAAPFTMAIPCAGCYFRVQKNIQPTLGPGCQAQPGRLAPRMSWPDCQLGPGLLRPSVLHSASQTANRIIML